MNFFKLFILLTSARVTTDAPATMRRVRKLCWWVMAICLGIAVLLSGYFAWDYEAARGLVGREPTAIVFFPYVAAALLIPVAYAFFGWVYFGFIGWIASAK
jgi:hypothetical protein